MATESGPLELLLVFALPTISIGGAILGRWVTRRWSALALGRVGHYVRLAVVLTLVALGAFLVVERAFGGRVNWLTYVVAGGVFVAELLRKWRST